ncbi:MAG: Nif3-like dinuclear metal center hexameric protein [Kiritimatiellae bacterium]|nr:Nif3-like dinuclear metal center hexameric protein [Kiritimatiellia bacterium]
MSKNAENGARRRVPLGEIVAALDAELGLARFQGDPSNNGLQVWGAPEGVAKVCCGVDASVAFYEEAARRGADMLFVHHGISWGSSLRRIAGANYALVAPLVKSGTALYAAHLPLDAHPVLGNNACIARALGLVDVEPFAEYAGFRIGVRGRFPAPLPWTGVKAKFRAICPGGRFEAFDGGRGEVRTACVVSGGGADEFPQACDAGIDCFLTGEIGLKDWNALLAQPIDFAAAGHYATERFGPRAVAEWIAGKFGIEAEFVDMGLPF